MGSGRAPRRGGGRRPHRSAEGRTPAGAARNPRRRNTAPASAAHTAVGREVPAGPFRLGAIPGATPGTWIDTWRRRMPHNPLELMPLDVATQRDALADGDVDMALVRLPVDADGLHVIRLYDEVAVVVIGVDDDLTAADELTVADLAGQVLITPRDDVLGFTASGLAAPSFASPETTKDAVELVAAGIGIAVMPMSLARLHHRKDVTYRPLVGGPVSTVALAWVAERTTALTDTFVGIVRGRTDNSSR